jgi:hypothetical protein
MPFRNIISGLCLRGYFWMALHMNWCIQWSRLCSPSWMIIIQLTEMGHPISSRLFSQTAIYNNGSLVPRPSVSEWINQTSSSLQLSGSKSWDFSTSISMWLRQYVFTQCEIDSIPKKIILCVWLSPVVKGTKLGPLASIQYYY